MQCLWWIPAAIPLLGALCILLSPCWPINRRQGARSDDETRGNWKKFGAYLVVNLAGCVLIALAMWGGAVSKQYFPEVWHFRATAIKHENVWTTKERRSKRVPDGTERVACGTDSQGRTKYITRTKYKTVYYSVTERHGPYWKAMVGGDWRNITEAEYKDWRSRWGNERQTGMHEGDAAFGDTAISGPIMECSWPGTMETAYPIDEVHQYANKIRVSNSILKFGTPTEQQLARFPRPADRRDTSPVVNWGGPGLSSEQILRLRQVNAFFGESRQIHAILVLFGKDEPRESVDGVMAAWCGPNKNELVTFMALDGQAVKWVEVRSWMDDTTLHATLRDALAGEPFSTERYAALLKEHIPRLWRRKEFTPLNEYLVVPVHPGWLVAGILLAGVLGFGSFLLIDRMTGDRSANHLNYWRPS